jgi:AsmA protein
MMMKILKILLNLIAASILLLITAIIVLPQFIDPNDYKEEIAATVKQKTGLELTINGQLSLSLFPWIGVNVGNITVSQPNVISRSVADVGDFARIEAMDIKVKLKPLFSRKIEVDTILLLKPRIEFVTNTAGKNSLDSLTNASAEAPQTNTEANTNTKTIAAFTLAGINLSDGQIIIDDRQAKTRYDIKQLNVKSGNILSNNTAPLSVSGLIESSENPSITLAIDTELSLNQKSLSLNAKNSRISIQQAENRLNAQIKQASYDHKSAFTRIENTTLSGNVVSIPFTLSTPEITADLNKHIAQIPSISATSLGVDLSGELIIKNWADLIVATGNLQSNTFNAKPILEKFALDYRPSKASALEKVAFSSDFNGTPNGVSLRNTRINLDETTLKGSLALVNFTNPSYRFDLSLSRIVIDDYLPASNANDNSTNTKTTAPTATQALVAPIALLAHIDANGVFRAEKIVANKLTIENNHVTVVSTKNNVVITPTLELYKGTFQGTITLNRAQSSLGIISQLKNVDLGPLLTDADITDQFSGAGNLSTDIVATDNNGQASSKGTITLSAKNGAIKGIDIKKVLDDAQIAIDKIRGKNSNPTTTATEDETRFAEMSATLLLNDNIISNNDLSIKAPAFRIAGNGTVDITAQTLDYLTSIIIVNTNTGQGGQNADQLKGATIPVRFTGPLAEPSYKIDVKALIKANSAAAVEKEKEKLKTKLLDKLGVSSTNSANGVTETKPTEEIKEDLKEKLKKKLFDKLF